jgi:hypothetical protein
MAFDAEWHDEHVTTLAARRTAFEDVVQVCEWRAAYAAACFGCVIGYALHVAFCHDFALSILARNHCAPPSVASFARWPSVMRIENVTVSCPSWMGLRP